MLTQVAGAPCLLAAAPPATSSTIVPRTAIPPTQPPGTLARSPGPRRGEHQHDGDDRHRAERDAHPEGQDLSDRLSHQRPA